MLGMALSFFYIRHALEGGPEVKTGRAPQEQTVVRR